jgi:hypothetical protein
MSQNTTREAMVCIKEKFNFKCFDWYSQKHHNKQVHICTCMYPLQYVIINAGIMLKTVQTCGPEAEK